MTSIFVDDPVEAFTFYTEVLGFQELMFMPEAHLAIVVSPEQPQGTSLLLEPSENPIVKPYRDGLWEQGIPAIVFGTADIQAEYERLSARGVVFRSEPQETDYGTLCLFEDTCGNLIQLFQAP